MTREFVLKNLEQIAKVFQMMEFVPFRVDDLFWEDKMQYIGVSKLFEPVEQGDVTPHYMIVITTNDKGEIAAVSAIKESEVKRH